VLLTIPELLLILEVVRYLKRHAGVADAIQSLDSSSPTVQQRAMDGGWRPWIECLRQGHGNRDCVGERSAWLFPFRHSCPADALSQGDDQAA
jgi:hypothetical protein